MPMNHGGVGGVHPWAPAAGRALRAHERALDRALDRALEALVP